MRNYLAAGILLGLLAGCSSPQDPADAGAAKATAGLALAGDAGSAFTSRAPMAGLASLPDRGELLAYETGRQVKHKAAYTAYPVAISEAHALNAMRTGEMVVNAPDGEPIRLSYERHEEGTDGNWTWIGRNADGASAVITFGEKAVFGVIPQGASDSLRLTMSAGRAWLVQTDRSKLAGMAGEPRREGGDQLVAPKLAGSGPSMASSQAQPAAPAAAAAATAVVDVLLGYTNGYAAQLGGQSQAVTRLVNMSAITNEAYAQSGVNMRIRLVRTLQVTYPDNTDNGDALEKLTGYQAGSGGGPITPDPAFNALREMRDEVGADLVSLVRAFRTPENAGCGIAWLIGGGQTGIVQADAPFGYSVVSDGTDIDEEDDNTYFCREETLAHELGHNMGQAHNQEDSDDSGVHAYSYGYREASSTGFYTVMAYPQADSSQFSIRYFANPSVKYSGRVTGVANQSDNARSLNLAMPIVATFRSTVIPLASRLRDDMNGDGKSDLFWHSSARRQQQGWKMDGASLTVGPVNAIGAYNSSGTGDFNGDGIADIIWVDGAKKDIWLWQGKTDGTYAATKIRAYPTGWNLVAIGDTNGDARDDIVWHNRSTGRVQVWRMRAAVIDYGPVNAIGAYTVIGAGDFNGDGLVDLAWADNARTKVWLWQASADGTFSSIYVRAFPTGWEMIGTGDINADGKSDLIWHSSALRRMQAWKMNGATFTYGRVNSIGAYTAGAVGDFNGDSYADIVWYDNRKTQVWMWEGKADGTFKATFVRAYPTGWNLLNRRPFR